MFFFFLFPFPCKLMNCCKYCGHFVASRATVFIAFVFGVLLAERMMWLQYAAENVDAANQTNASSNASARASLRRMSQTVLGLAHEDSNGATVLPEVRGEAVAESAALPPPSDGTNKADSADKQASFTDTLTALGNTLVICTIAIAYPVSVLPYYRAEKTTEYVLVKPHPRTIRWL